MVLPLAGRFVQEVGAGFVFVALSPTLRGRLHAADCSGPPARLADLVSAFSPGQPLQCRVLQVPFPDTLPPHAHAPNPSPCSG